MLFVPRDRRTGGRFAYLRATLFFLAAGVWLGGVIAQRPAITLAAIFILVAALLLRILDRGGGASRAEAEDAEAEEGWDDDDEGGEGASGPRAP